MPELQCVDNSRGSNRPRRRGRDCRERRLVRLGSAPYPRIFPVGRAVPSPPFAPKINLGRGFGGWWERPSERDRSTRITGIAPGRALLRRQRQMRPLAREVLKPCHGAQPCEHAARQIFTGGRGSRRAAPQGSRPHKRLGGSLALQIGIRRAQSNGETRTAGPQSLPMRQRRGYGATCTPKPTVPEFPGASKPLNCQLMAPTVFEVGAVIVTPVKFGGSAPAVALTKVL